MEKWLGLVSRKRNKTKFLSTQSTPFKYREQKIHSKEKI